MSIIQFKDILKEADYKYDKLTIGSVNRLIRFGINRLIGSLKKDNEILLQKNGGNVLFCKDFNSMTDYYDYIKQFKLVKRNRDNRLKTYYNEEAISE